MEVETPGRTKCQEAVACQGAKFSILIAMTKNPKVGKERRMYVQGVKKSSR